jgi:hypothetical protein
MAIRDIDYIHSRFESGDRPSEQDYIDLIDTLSARSTDLGTAGNNELEVSGIENATVIDEVPLASWRMVKYLVSIAKKTGGANRFYATEFSILIDANGDVHVSEYGSIDNDGDIGTITATAANGNLKLMVTPNPAIIPITARFARIGLKA